DDAGRLHAEDRAAILFGDGWYLYAWHGTIVPARAVVGEVTLHDVRNEPNAEIRRVLLERYGEARYIEECGAAAVAQDDFGTLYRADLADDEPLVAVRVRNSTPEPDGSHRPYWLRVPPNVRTPREAVA